MSIGSVIVAIVLLGINIKITLDAREIGYIWSWYKLTGAFGILVLALAPNGTFINEIGIVLLDNLIAFLFLILATNIKNNLNINDVKDDILLIIYIVSHIGGIFLLGMLLN